MATGARHAYFGHEEWEPFAPRLKKIEDSTESRRRILIAFEKVETEPDPTERSRLLSFAVIGGDPTGVEMAGAIAELARRALTADFRNIDRLAAQGHRPRVVSAWLSQPRHRAGALALSLRDLPNGSRLITGTID